MLKGRGRDPRGVTSPPAHPMMHSPRLPSPTPGNHIMHSPGQVPPTKGHATMRSPGLATRPAQQQRALPARPEPDYEVVEFPSDQYVNAKLQPPPPPPPRPPTGHPVQASCGLCGGGGARVRCAECGRRALCASCDDMYHRHPKRRHHQRQALSLTQLGEDRPPLPPKGTPPVPPPRRNKMSASPMPPMTPILDQRRTTLNHSHATMPGMRTSASPTMQHTQVHQPLLVQTKMVNNPGQMGSMPFLPTTMPHQPPIHMQPTANTLGHLNVGWNRPRGSLQGFPHVPQVQEPWESPESIPLPAMGQPQWGRPMRRGASTLELGGAAASCAGCAHCAPPTWRYGSCATLDQPWGVGQGGWPMQQCCPPQQSPHGHFHMHQHMPQTPQPYRRADSRAMSRAASRTGSRAASPAMSVRSRTSRRTKHRTPSPPMPSSDADSESESEPAPKPRNEHSNARPERTSSRSERPSSRSERPSSRSERPSSRSEQPSSRTELADEDSLGPIPPPPDAPWQCEHCTYVNEPGVRVCVICCRTPTAAPKVIAEGATNFEKLHITSRSASPAPERVDQVSERTSTKSQKERTSTGCGPSPPRVVTVSKNITQRLVTPTRDQNGGSTERQTRHDMAVGPSPPKETRPIRYSTAVGSSPPKETLTIHSTNDSTDHGVRASPYPETKSKVERHSVSVGPSPPRENTKQESNFTGQKKFVGTSPPRDVRPESRSSSITGKTNVSNTGTSPPPQSISTQTYEDPNSYERAPSVTRSRPRRRFRDDRRERSHSRHSLSSDTRESDRSVRTTGAWEWRERDSSPSVGGGGGEWGGKLARRASHLDVRRRDVRPRRTSLYGSEAASPEPVGSGRAISMEVLSGGRSAERGLELARLLAEAERLGFSAAEVQVGLSQCPGSPLSWLRSRWAGLVGAVQGAAARLAPRCALSEAEARAALAAHRGAVWPAVTHCVDKLRKQSERAPVSGEGRMRGRVWGSPAGADDEAAPRRAEDSSDEYDAPPVRYPEEWYPPIDGDAYELDREIDLWNVPVPDTPAIPTPLPPLARDSAEVAFKLRSLLLEAGIPSIDENLLLKGLLSNVTHTNLTPEPNTPSAKPSLDFIQSENDFIDAYNALTRASPLPNISKVDKVSEKKLIGTESKAEEELILKDDEPQPPNVEDQHKNITIISHHHDKHKNHSSKQKSQDANRIKSNHVTSKEKQRFETGKAVQQEKIHSSNNNINHVYPGATLAPHVSSSPSDIKDTLPDIKKVQTTKTEEKANNLNEIVDNTQKLIQQMKEEINSDIHSLDDGHSQTSLSDRDSSSHDEQESSYSESEEETDKMSMTSDEKEISTGSSSEDERDNVKQVPSFVNRTSSEDNEQFEEALDNLDTQIEDVKHANIEILDSIARSLQEEHTISIEVNEPNQNHLKIDNSNSRIIETNEPKNLQSNNSRNISIVVDAPKEKHFMREDSNNNIFIEVNSFEEIYDELNTSNVNKKSTPQKTETNGIQKKNEVTENIPIEPKISPTKYAINESVFKVVSPTRVIILDNQEPIYNAILENIEIINENETVESAAELIHDVVDVDTVNVFVNVDVQEIIHSESVNSSNDALSPEIINNAITSTATETVSNDDINFIDASSSLVEAPVSYEQVTIDQENEDVTQSQITSVQPIQNEIIIKQDTPERIIINPTSSGNKSSNTVKSNIPKPVRATPNNKTKNDKTAPKLLVSKVPVRRGSLKQYHAPAPPKTHFGNVQSGHVKQLQSKIFNSKDIGPAKPPRTEIEVKPSTSTASLKKSPAPQPPKKHEQNQPGETLPPEEKSNNYFRETCRTEDEWTESDSDESQTLRQTSVEEVQPATPTPPPPITLRRVSGNIIDLAKVRLPEGSPERQARMLLAEGATETWAQAQLAVQLAGSGDATLACALLAALQCADLPAALAYLHQECELCAERLPQHEMVSMLRCTHRCCRECARLYFTVQVTERSIVDCVCPFCKLPELEALPEDAWLEYFAHLDIQLKTLLDTDVHELFQRKLRDRTLAMDPNFKWCMECSSGFFVHPKQKKLRCPECRSVTCAACRKSWSQNHEGLSCEQYAAWLADNDPEISVAAVQQHLRENGLECPRCHFKYSLSRGGCMHFTCTQCKYEFCYGCGKPFTMGARCGLSDYCAKLGLHAHHPRNCLFYLRDKEPHELQTLLQMNNVAYEIETSEGTNGRCPIPLQRETPTGLVDGICGSEAPPKHAGLCKNHYLEYLTRTVRARGCDPLPLLAVDDLETLVKRAGLRLPPRPYGSLEGLYRRALTEVTLCLRCRPHYVEYLAACARPLDPIPIMQVSELVAELRRRALPLPERGPWDSDPIYAGMCAEIVKEKIPLD